MSARLAAVRLGRTIDDVVVLADDPRSAFLLAPEGAAIPAGFDVPDEWIVGHAPDPADVVPVEDAPVDGDESTGDDSPAELDPADDVPVEDDQPAKPKGRKKTW